jgi:anti-anti-sigma factor
MDYETPDMVVREMDGVTVVRLREPNFTGVNEIHHVTAELDAILARGVRKLVVDFKHVEFIGSAALGMLISLQKKVDAKGGKMVLSHSENIAELLKVSHTTSIFKLAADPKVAMKMLK